MKVYLQVLSLLVLSIVILTACGRDNQRVSAPNYDMSIRWGYGYGGGELPELPPDAEIVNRISSTFRVSIIPEPMPNGYDEYSPPNIFESSSNPHDLLQHGTTRTIPMDMIRRFAPNYYNLLMSVPFGLGVYTDHATGDLMGLPIYHGTNYELLIYSAYRLDWLERHNIPLPDDIVPIREGEIYFTPTPFTHEQFIEIMGVFSGLASETGFAIMRRYGQLSNLRALKGMWGLGNGIVNDNGRPNYYFADPRYKEFLQFMAYMYGERMFTSPNDRVAPRLYDNLRHGIFRGQDIRTGWFQTNLSSILAPEGAGALSWLIESQGARFLITPPEIGPFGDSGVGISSVSPFDQTLTWMISSQTSDEELAVILEIFNYISFDVDAYIMVNYGFEGEHFEWEGVPFESLIVRTMTNVMDAFNSGAFFLRTGISGPIGNEVYFGNNALTNYSTSDAGRRAVILPYREDIHGDFVLRYAELTARYGEELLRIRERFFVLAIRGQIDIEAEWQSYIDELNANGLQQFLALVEHFPSP